MGKLIPSDLEQCACLNKVYGTARRDPEAARCLKSNGLPVPKRGIKKVTNLTPKRIFRDQKEHAKAAFKEKETRPT